MKGKKETNVAILGKAMKNANTGAGKPQPAGRVKDKAAAASVKNTKADKIAKPDIKTNADSKKRK